MKTNRILTLLSVCSLFAGTATLNMVANYRHEHGSCHDGSCGRSTCGTCHRHNSCPVDTYEAGTCKEGESKAHETVAMQDKDGEMYIKGNGNGAATAAAATSEEEAMPASSSRRGKRMKNQ
jgi:hypothetical protein